MGNDLLQDHCLPSAQLSINMWLHKIPALMICKTSNMNGKTLQLMKLVGG